MQGGHVRRVRALVGLRPTPPEYDLARTMSLEDCASDIIDDAQYVGSVMVVVNKREGVFFGAGIDRHVIERGYDGLQQADRVQVDQRQAVEIDRLVGPWYRRCRPALVLNRKILFGGLFGNLIDRTELLEHAENGMRVGQNRRVG